jgi:hypothetical protein
MVRRGQVTVTDSRTGMGAVEKNLLNLPGIEPQFFGRSDRSLVSIPTELSGLHLIFIRTKHLYMLTNKAREQLLR